MISGKQSNINKKYSINEKTDKKINKKINNRINQKFHVK